MGDGGPRDRVLTLPKVQGVRLLELERGALLRRLPEEAPHDGWGAGPARGWPEPAMSGLWRWSRCAGR